LDGPIYNNGTNVIAAIGGNAAANVATSNRIIVATNDLRLDIAVGIDVAVLESGGTNIIGAIGALAANAVIPETQGNIAGTWAIDFTVGRVQSGVQTGAVTNVTFTVSSTNAESSLVYQLFSNGGSVTWDTNTTTFVGGTAPTLTSNEWNTIFMRGFRGRYHVGKAGSAP